MKTTVIYGIEHKRNTYNVVQMLIKRLGITDEELTEFFLPKDLPHFCTGCNNCFTKGEDFCPHAEFTMPIREAFLAADVIIFASPTHVFNVSGQMKAFADHFAFMGLAHRPEPVMYKKVGIAVSSTAGAGMRPALKYLKQLLGFLGISQIYKLGITTSRQSQTRLKKDIERIAQKVKIPKKSKPSAFAIMMYYVIKSLHKKDKSEFMAYDRAYWESRGWLGKSRPWS
ncbi:MAG: flavodoxin family protein [Defluviitaleaceae bacterium]|nr:flavodoxin family protein [Defluviitaleaceae bacterium]